MELRDIKSKKKHNVRYRTSDMVERVKLETKDYQVLYTEGHSWLAHFNLLKQVMPRVSICAARES